MKKLYQTEVPDSNHPSVVLEPRDPVNGYIRGALRLESGMFLFTAYRQPYLKLTKQSYASVGEFKAAYSEQAQRGQRL